MYTVATALYPNTLASSITLPLEILQAASQMASARKRGAKQMQFLMTGSDRKTLTVTSGIKLKADVLLTKLPPPDLLILPAIWRNPRTTINASEQLITLLPQIADTGARICSVGTASCLLAEAGVLDGRPATTHWNYFEQFSRHYPTVKLKRKHLITQSDNIYCVGSVNSIADLMIHIIEEWFGSRVARAVEKQFSPEIRQSFRAASYQNEADSSHHDELVLEGQQWLQEHLTDNTGMSALARHLGFGTRTLNRRFKLATGLSPQAYLQSLRISTARELLRSSNLSISDIAWQVGLQDASYFTQLFRQHTGASPLQYRKQVRGKLFAPS